MLISSFGHLLVEEYPERVRGGRVLQVQQCCFNEFPDQCTECPEYSETRQDQATQLMLLAGMGMMYAQPYLKKVIKECRLYHKRKVEYLK
jgi:hypothetical protein